MLRSLILFCFLGALVGCRSKEDKAVVAVDPALATLVPADTTYLIGTRVEKLQATPVYQKHVAKLPLSQLDEFAKKTGVDPRKDIWELLFCSNGKDGALMARGKFGSDMEPKLEGEGVTRSSYNGFVMYGDERNAVVFISPSTAVGGSTAYLKKIIDERQKSRGIPQALLDQIKTVPKESQFWAVFAGGVGFGFPENSNLGNLNQFARALDRGSLSADLRSGVRLVGIASCRDSDGAKKVHDALRGLIGVGRLSTKPGQDDLLRVYDSIKVTQQDQKVNLNIDLPDDLVDRFLATFGK